MLVGLFERRPSWSLDLPRGFVLELQRSLGHSQVPEHCQEQLRAKLDSMLVKKHFFYTDPRL